MSAFGLQLLAFFSPCGLLLDVLNVLKVHITQGDHEGKAVIVSWVTPNKPGSNKVLYWSEKSKQKKQTFGKVYTYKFYNYTSGYIHHCTIDNLKVLAIQSTLPVKATLALVFRNSEFSDSKKKIV